MSVPFKFRPAPPKLRKRAMGSAESRQWFDNLVQCSTSIARTIEVRKVAANEVPLVLASLVIALSDHTGVPKETILAMVTTGVSQLSSEAPEAADTFEGPFEIRTVLERRLANLLFGEEYRAESLGVIRQLAAESILFKTGEVVS